MIQKPNLRYGWLLRDVIPDPLGMTGFALLVVVTMGFLLLEPDEDGCLFMGQISLLPAFLRGPALDAFYEGTAQALLISGPAVALYFGVRHLLCQADSVIPYFTLVGGGSLTMVTWVGVVTVLFS